MDTPTLPDGRANMRFVLAGLVALAAFATDRVTKAMAESSLIMREPKEIIGDYVRLTLWYNEGAAFGVRLGGQWVHVALSLAAMALVAWLIWNTPRQDRLSLIGFGLIMGGAVGNLYDRFVAGRVTDFIEVGAGSYRWPTFNLADSWVVIGIGVLLLAHFMGGAAQEARSDAHVDEHPAHPAGSEGRTP